MKNRLQFEKSPYLLQHADNPVDWYPWREEAFEKARNEDKPVFLSVGYSTCHWCHVMAHESFEDDRIARLMNEVFVNVKVDREERPDIDGVYMTVCQMATGSGGWPLTIIMTPDKAPFFAGTYFPKESRFGRIGMSELIPKIASLWHERRNELLDSAGQIHDFLNQSSRNEKGGELHVSVLDQAFEELSARFDGQHGGFGDAPKFPTPHHLMFLLRCWKRTGDDRALLMVEKTIQEMRCGGIYDHIGFGFHRYSTDERWLLPHFEKMLYDQALLALAYTETWQATAKDVYRETAVEIFEYILRDMTSPEGAFFSGEDADSEGVEGKFYLWSEKEIREILDAKEADVVIRAFNIAREGNFVEEASGARTGENILYRTRTYHELAEALGLTEDGLRKALAENRKKLFEAREKRIHPHKDDKVLTDWNGLMIAALARGARVFNDGQYADAAGRASAFILERMRRDDGRLHHRFREGEASISGFLDDYAFLVWGLIELYEADFDARWLEAALDLNVLMIRHFWDGKDGGFFFTPDDGEKLLVRKKEIYDGAVPSGNSVAFWNLLRLSRMTGDASLDEKAAAIARAFSRSIEQIPSAYTQFLVAHDFALGPTFEIVIAGRIGRKDTQNMIRALYKEYIPRKVVVFRPTDDLSPSADCLAEYTKTMKSTAGRATAYVCRSGQCERPTTGIRTMMKLLRQETGFRKA
jgi:uncharacterized protein YyaL (SSP411 family)